jgi:retron-type reverse transcriptase
MFDESWRRFRQGKATREVLEFEYDLERNLFALEQDVQNGTYRHGGYRTVEIADKKRRTLHVATVRDRVVHRFLYDALVQICEPAFDDAVFSGRKGRGLGKALEQSRAFLAKYPGAFVLRADIKKAFEHIDHQILLYLLRRKLQNCMGGGFILGFAAKLLRVSAPTWILRTPRLAAFPSATSPARFSR